MDQYDTDQEALIQALGALMNAAFYSGMRGLAFKLQSRWMTAMAQRSIKHKQLMEDRNLGASL